MEKQQTTTKLSTETLALIEEEVRYLLSVMGFNEAHVSCSCKNTKDREGSFRQQLCVDINDKEAGRMLIGVRGSCLSALSHVIRSVIRRKLGGVVYVAVDVNGYLATRERNLLSLAEEAARKAGRGGRAIVLSPMTASERHVVHTALAKREDVSTESLGEDPNRRVVVRPVFV